MLQGPGENAGAIDIGDGWAVVFKIESHNHPSFIEPFQGAATGVGGILRDIFTMGARPIALLDSLRFGDPADRARGVSSTAWCPASVVRQLLRLPDGGRRDRLRAGVRGQPAGERDVRRAGPRPIGSSARGPRARQSRLLRRQQDRARRHPRRDHGLGDLRRARRGAAADGAGRRSRSPRSSCSRRAWRRWPAAWWSASRTWARRAWPAAPPRCRRAAGRAWTSSSSRVPQREAGDDALRDPALGVAGAHALVAARGREAALQRSSPSGSSTRSSIGQVTERRRPAWSVIAATRWPTCRSTPSPRRRCTRSRTRAPAWLARAPGLRSAVAARAGRPRRGAGRRCSLRPTIASKQWAFRQYDQQVGINTLVLPGSDAAVLRVKGTRARHRRVDRRQRPPGLPRPAPRRRPGRVRGGPQRVVRGRPAARRDRLHELRLARASRHPLAVRRGHRGHRRGVPRARAARWSAAMFPSTMRPPARPSCRRPSSAWWGCSTMPARWRRSGSRAPASAIALLGPEAVSLGGSEYLWTRHGRLAGALAPLDLETERRVQAAARGGHRRRPGDRGPRLRGGWPGGGARRGVHHGTRAGGCEVTLPAAAARAIRRCSARARRASWWRWRRVAQREFEALMAESAIPWRWLGTTGGDRLRLRMGSITVVDMGRTGSSTHGGTALNATWRDDKFHDECGLFGIWNHPEAAQRHLSRPLRAPASRPGVGGHRDHRRQRLPPGEGDGLGRRRLQPRAPAAPARSSRHRPRALLDRRLARISATRSRSPRRSRAARSPSPTTAT